MGSTMEPRVEPSAGPVTNVGQIMAKASPRSHAAAAWLALFVTFLWSSSWVLIRWGLDDEGLAPVTFAALRYGLAAIILVGWLATRGRRQLPSGGIDRRSVGQLLLLGVLLYGLTQGAQFVALAEQPAATTSLVLSLTPLFVAATAILTSAEVPTRWQLAGSVLVALGAGLYFAGDLSATSAGMVAAVIALAANVASAILGRRVNRFGRLPPLLVTAVSMSAGALVLVAVGLVGEGLPDVSLRGWLLIGWLALVNTALAFSLWNLSLQRLTAVESAGINNTMLIQVAVLAWLFLGESPGPIGLLGVLVVSAGVFLTQSAWRKRPASTNGNA